MSNTYVVCVIKVPFELDKAIESSSQAFTELARHELVDSVIILNVLPVEEA